MGTEQTYPSLSLLPEAAVSPSSSFIVKDPAEIVSSSTNGFGKALGGVDSGSVEMINGSEKRPSNSELRAATLNAY